MFTTAQFRVFTTEPEERVLSRPRNFLRQGNNTEAEASYQEVVRDYPELKAAWAEYFQLLRAEGRFDDALALAEQVRSRFGDDALSFALRGAAQIELGSFREALESLERAAQQDPNFGMVWHEMGYAAFRMGQPGPALLALDRAFALDPRSGTLHLRGKILRNSGQYLAAEVAFSGAAESAEFPEQRAEAEKQIAITRRYAGFERRPCDIAPTRRWFAETGAVLLVAGGEARIPSDEEIVAGLVRLSMDLGWRFTAVVKGDAWPGWDGLGGALGAPVIAGGAAEMGAVPLAVVRRPHQAGDAWMAASARIHASKAGLTFVLEQPDGQHVADVAGHLAGMDRGSLDLAFAVQCAVHPEGRLKGRKLR